MDLEKLKYPIGKIPVYNGADELDFDKAIQDIQDLPDRLMDLTLGLNPNDLLQVYRPGGWNIKQLIHHLADSHMNSFIRFKLVITEGDGAIIKPYLENEWVKTADVEHEVDDSLLILKGLHSRWAKLISSFSTDDLNKGFYHPEMKLTVPLYNAIAMYQWHGNHHLEHIKIAINNME